MERERNKERKQQTVYACCDSILLLFQDFYLKLIQLKKLERKRDSNSMLTMMLL